MNNLKQIPWSKWSKTFQWMSSSVHNCSQYRLFSVRGHKMPPSSGLNRKKHFIKSLCSEISKDLTLFGLARFFSARSTLVRTKMVLLPWGSIWLTRSVTILRSASTEPSEREKYWQSWLKRTLVFYDKYFNGRKLTLNAEDNGIWILHVGFTNAKNCFFCVSSHAGCHSLYTNETVSDIKHVLHRCIWLYYLQNCMKCA